MNQHEKGAKLDQGKNQIGMVLQGFSHAIPAVAEVGTFGAKKYSKFGFLHVEDGQARYIDAMMRHLFAHHNGEINDPETGLSHLSAVAWNSLALLELNIRSLDTEIK